MQSYTDLIKALRCCAEHKYRCLECEFLHDGVCSVMHDAAAAIEELEAEVDKWTDVAYQDSLEQMKMQERIWELEALKEAHIKPSYGEWLTVEVNPLDRMHNPIYECTCSRCHEEYTLATIPNYCPNCGAKMDVEG